MKRMAEEETQGPAELTSQTNKDVDQVGSYYALRILLL